MRRNRLTTGGGDRSTALADQDVAKKASKEESKKGETSKDEKGNKKDEKKEVELSDEDLALKESLELCVFAARSQSGSCEARDGDDEARDRSTR